MIYKDWYYTRGAFETITKKVSTIYGNFVHLVSSLTKELWFWFWHRKSFPNRPCHTPFLEVYPQIWSLQTLNWDESSKSEFVGYPMSITCSVTEWQIVAPPLVKHFFFKNLCEGQTRFYPRGLQSPILDIHFLFQNSIKCKLLSFSNMSNRISTVFLALQ